jgi:hypothetical protein
MKNFKIARPDPLCVKRNDTIVSAGS